jgi:hypothetical protein
MSKAFSCDGKREGLYAGMEQRHEEVDSAFERWCPRDFAHKKDKTRPGSHYIPASVKREV